MSPTADDRIEVREWDLEEIERELVFAKGEAINLPRAERIIACLEAALVTLSKLLGRA